MRYSSIFVPVLHRILLEICLQILVKVVMDIEIKRHRFLTMTIFTRRFPLGVDAASWVDTLIVK